MANHLPKYQEWGLCEWKVSNPVKTCPLNRDALFEMQKKAASLINLNGMKLAYAAQVGHYQGDGFNVPAGLLRYTVSGALDLGKEHISFAFEQDSLKLLGMTRMQAGLAEGELISPKDALKVMIAFLQTNAPDLMPADVKAVDISKQIAGNRADFESKPIALGNVELQWIDDHPETIKNEQIDAIEIHGQKVKMYLPKTGLWAWGIVGNDGAVITFERNIFWNFAAFQRETQMWLHDGWLLAHKILK